MKEKKTPKGSIQIDIEGPENIEITFMGVIPTNCIGPIRVILFREYQTVYMRKQAQYERDNQEELAAAANARREANKVALELETKKAELEAIEKEHSADQVDTAEDLKVREDNIKEEAERMDPALVAKVDAQKRAQGIKPAPRRVSDDRESQKGNDSSRDDSGSERPKTASDSESGTDTARSSTAASKWAALQQEKAKARSAGD